MIQISLSMFRYGIHVLYYNIAGAERYRAITTSHIRNADGAYLVYDITNENSFQTLDFWYECIKKATDDDIVVYLIGNKLDLIRNASNNRKISTQKALEFARKYNMRGFCECSAKDNVNIVQTSERFFKGGLF
jgi:GTPase SAR1 family protein